VAFRFAVLSERGVLGARGGSECSRKAIRAFQLLNGAETPLTNRCTADGVHSRRRRIDLPEERQRVRGANAIRDAARREEKIFLAGGVN